MTKPKSKTWLVVRSLADDAVMYRIDVTERSETEREMIESDLTKTEWHRPRWCAQERPQLPLDRFYVTQVNETLSL